MAFKSIDYRAKADHFAELASRAAYAGAVATNAGDREAWEERAARYDAQSAACLARARIAA